MTTLATHIAPKCYTFTVDGGDTHTTSFGGTAVSLSIENMSSQGIVVTFNGDDDASMMMAEDSILTFPPHFAHFTSVTFDNTQSGAGNVDISIIAGVLS